MRERTRRAWQDTKSVENWRWRGVEIVVVLAATYWVLRRWWLPSDAMENVAVGVVAAVVTLLLVPALEFGMRWTQAGPRIAEERVPLQELRRVFSDNVRLHGPQRLALGGTLLWHGVTLTQQHIGALRTLQSNGEVKNVEFRRGFNPITGEFTLDAFVDTIRVLDA